MNILSKHYMCTLVFMLIIIVFTDPFINKLFVALSLQSSCIIFQIKINKFSVRSGKSLRLQCLFHRRSEVMCPGLYS